MEIWEEKQTSKCGKKETALRYDYFLKYLHQKGRRSVRRVYEELKDSQQGKQKIPSFKTLRGYCTEFNWVKRAKAYDKFQRELKEEEKQKLLADDLLEEARLNHEEMQRGYKQLPYVTKGIVSLYEDLEAQRINSLEYASGMLRLMTAYEKGNRGNKMVRPPEEKPNPTINTINQIGDNHASFHQLMQEKGEVIDELVRDRARREFESSSE